MQSEKELKKVEECDCTVKRDEGGKNAGKKKMLFIIVCCILFVTIGVIYLVTRPEKVYLENYLPEEIETTGYDGYATLQLNYIFDYNAFMEDICNDDNDYHNSPDEEAWRDLMETSVRLEAYDEVEQSLVFKIYVNGQLSSVPSNLKNGDKVKIKVYSDIEESEKLDKKFIGGSKEYIVKNLEEATVISPFDEKYFSISISGGDGKGVFEWKVAEGFVWTDYLSYSIVSEKYKNFSNGDKVTLQVTYDEDYFSQKGYVLSENTKEFTVEGLGRYVESIDEIPKDLLAQLKNDAANKIANDPDADEYGEKIYQKIYFMSQKDNVNHIEEELNYPQNRLLIVYTTKTLSWSFDFYACVLYSEITINGDKILFDGYENETEGATVDYYASHIFEGDMEDYKEIYKIETID